MSRNHIPLRVYDAGTDTSSIGSSTGLRFPSPVGRILSPCN